METGSRCLKSLTRQGESQELTSLSISVHAGLGIPQCLWLKSTGSAKCLTGLLGYNDLHAIVMHALNWERRFIERRSSIHPQLTTSSVSAQVSFVSIPTARQMRSRRYGTT